MEKMTGEQVFNQILVTEDVENIIKNTKPFAELMMKYNCAVKEINTKFEVLDREFGVRYNRNPVETIKTRIKSPLSIVNKLKKKELPLSTESIATSINDVAGIRIICSFIEDIYYLAEVFLRQDDIRLIRKKDYIAEPKSNGYRSLHLIVEVPIFLTDKKEFIKVEVQFRTIAMDFWASLEHKLKYKKNLIQEKIITKGLCDCATRISELDLYMQEIHHYIEEEN